jgi:RND family efflux transporter MFP subunit
MKIRNTKGRTPIILALVVIVALIVVMMLLKPPPKPIIPSKEKPLLVSVIEAQLTDVPDTIYLPSLIQANVDAMLSAEKPGRIVKLHVDRGDRVKKGQVLLQLDDRIAQADLKSAEIAKKEAANNYARFQQLQESGAVAPSQYEEIERQSITADALYQSALVNIDQCQITSPIDGVINDRLVEEGEYVQPGSPAFQVVDLATVKVNIQIPEKDIYAINPGEPMRFTIQPLPKHTFTGTVTFVAAQAGSQNNAFRAQLTADNPDGRLRPGMIAQVEFNRGSRSNMLSLPIAAVLPSNGDHIVYLIENDQAIRRKVQIEKMSRDFVLISDGLNAGDLVITEGNRTLSDGQRVERAKAGSDR